MIELDLAKVGSELVWLLEVLAAIRCMCVKNGIEWAWCSDQELEVAKLLRTVRKIIKVRGDVMQVAEKG